MSHYAPRLFMLKIPTDKIRDLIGPGGKKIRSIIEATGVKIDVMDDGKVHVFASDGTVGRSRAADDPRRHRHRRNRQDLSRQGRAPRGFRRLRRNLSRAPTACCTSAKSPKQRIRDVRDELKLGDQVLVKVLAIEGNKIRLSRKAILREQRDKQAKAEAAPQ